MGGAGAVGGGPVRGDRLYLGWEFALRHAHPGPPPRRPPPPAPQHVDPGWVAAQRREERRLGQPLRAGVGAGLAAAAAAAALGTLGIVNPALAVAGTAASAVLVLACARGLWRGRRDLRNRLAAEERRVGLAQAAADRRLAAWQDEHGRRLREWQARGRAFRTQAQWYGVAVPAAIDRIDVAGGTLGGWSALVAMLGGFRLAAGGEVTVLDLSEGAVARDLLGVARGLGVQPLVWVLPGDLARFDLGAGVPGDVLADLLAVAVSAAADPDGPASGTSAASPADPAQDSAILERIAGVLGAPGDPGDPGDPGGLSIARLAAGLRVLAQVGDLRDEVRRGLVSEAEAEAVTGLYGRAAADRVIIERALMLEARLRPLTELGRDPVPLPPSRLRVVAMDRSSRMASGQVTGGYVAAALTHLLRGQPRGEGWRHTLLLCGAERLRGDVLDRLSDACEFSGTGLVLTYRSLSPHVRDRLGRGNAAVAFMRLGNAEDARVASEQIGTEHRFVVAQLTDTVGSSVTDTAGDAYTSTVGSASSVALSTSSSQGSGRSGGRGQSWPGMSPFAPRTASSHAETSYSAGVSDSASITEGITTGTAWGRQTARAAGITASAGRTAQRSREFLVEQHALQQLPPSALIVSYASAAGRRVVLADANPGILGLPTATLRTWDEAGPVAVAAAAGAAAAGPDAVAGADVVGAAGAAADGGSGPEDSGAMGTPGAAAGPGAPGTASVRPPGPWDRPGAGRAAWDERGSGPGRTPSGAPSWAGPVPPLTRDPAQAPLSWREDDGVPPA
jgi:hypothetical protein